MQIRVYDPPEEFDPTVADAVAQLADFEVGEVVRYGDGERELGVVLEVMSDLFPWPEAEGDTVDPEDVADGGTVYIVSRGSGGSGLYESGELEAADESELRPEGMDEDDVVGAVDDAELGEAYPDDMGCQSCGDGVEVEELVVNVPGVEDPETGWNDWPDSWEEADKPARLIFLDMWSSVGAQFRTCRARLGGRIGGNINRFCAASKDEAWGTTAWRKFND